MDFDISEADEYAMASEAWYNATDPVAVMTGEDIMLAAYISTSLSGEIYIPQVYQIIIDTNASKISGNHEEYFQHCAEFGTDLASNADGKRMYKTKFT